MHLHAPYVMLNITSCQVNVQHVHLIVPHVQMDLHAPHVMLNITFGQMLVQPVLQLSQTVSNANTQLPLCALRALHQHT